MDIFIIRNRFTLKSSISDCQLVPGGPRFCVFLEDRDRGLASDMPLSELMARKIKHETAIPVGRYLMEISWSKHWSMNVPHLLGVPAFDEIEQHPGNDCDDTDGCQLPGLTPLVNYVENSRVAWGRLVAVYKTARAGEKIWVNVQRDQKAWSDFIAKFPLPQL